MKLQTAEAARILQITPAAVRQMELRGELEAERTLGGVRLFEQSVVERKAAERKAKRMTAGGVTECREIPTENGPSALRALVDASTREPRPAP